MKRKLKYLRPRPDNLTSFDRWRNQTVTDMEDMMHVLEWTNADLARHAKLCPSTVSKLRKRQTREPRASTIFNIAKSLGLSLTVEESQAPILKLRKRG